MIEGIRRPVKLPPTEGTHQKFDAIILLYDGVNKRKTKEGVRRGNFETSV